MLITSQSRVAAGGGGGPDQWWIYIVKFWKSPSGSKFFQFLSYGENLQNCMLALPPRGNPGSATDDTPLPPANEVAGRLCFYRCL